MSCERPLLILLFSMIISHSSVQAVESTDSTCALRVGWEDWSPYVYREDGRLTGEEFHVLQQLGDSAGCTLIYVEAPWARALELLRQQKIEVLYAATQTPSRETFARFSRPYRYEHMRLVSRPEISGNDDVISLNDWLKPSAPGESASRLGVVRGYHYGGTLESAYRSIEPDRIVEVGSDNQLQEMLLINRIDGYLAEDLVAHEHVAEVSVPMAVYAIDEAEPEPMRLMFGLQVPEVVVKRFDEAIGELHSGDLGAQ